MTWFSTPAGEARNREGYPMMWFASLRFRGVRFESANRMRVCLSCSCQASIYGKTVAVPITLGGVEYPTRWHAEASPRPLWQRHLCPQQRRFEEEQERAQAEKWNAERPRVTREEARQWLSELSEATQEMLKGEVEREREQRRGGRR